MPALCRSRSGAARPRRATRWTASDPGAPAPPRAPPPAPQPAPRRARASWGSATGRTVAPPRPDRARERKRSRPTAAGLGVGVQHRRRPAAADPPGRRDLLPEAAPEIVVVQVLAADGLHRDVAPAGRPPQIDGAHPAASEARHQPVRAHRPRIARPKSLHPCSRPPDLQAELRVSGAGPDSVRGQLPARGRPRCPADRDQLAAETAPGRSMRRRRRARPRAGEDRSATVRVPSLQ
jgi:hypothetical protein